MYYYIQYIEEWGGVIEFYAPVYDCFTYMVSSWMMVDTGIPKKNHCTTANELTNLFTLDHMATEGPYTVKLFVVFLLYFQ